MDLSETERHRIEELVKKITVDSIGSLDPCGFCFSTSFALSIYLKINDVNTSIKAGTFNNRNHFWLTLDNYPDIIVDATIKQFDKLQDPIYIGKINCNEITKQYDQKTYGLNEWLHFYGIWREPLIDKFYLIQRTEEFKEKVVISTFAAAAIINWEIEQKTDIDDFLKSYPFKYYFGPIYQGLRDKWSKNESVIKILQNKLPDKFDKLLTKAQK